MNDKFIDILPVIGIIIAIVVVAGHNLNKKEEPKDPVSKVVQGLAQNKVENSSPEGYVKKENMNTPEISIDVNKKYQAKFKTNYGEFTINLFAKETPVTVNNFVTLARKNFYNGLIFHRVIPDFMIQGGDPEGTGGGGPGYKFNDEVSPKKLVKGSLAMANAGPNTNGSQFFIVTAQETPWLDGRHTNFGEVTNGLDVVEKIGKVETGQNDKPIKDVIINSIEIIEQ